VNVLTCSSTGFYVYNDRYAEVKTFQLNAGSRAIEMKARWTGNLERKNYDRKI